MVIRVIGEDWDPMESVNVSDIFDPFFPLRTIVFKWNKEKS